MKTLVVNLLGAPSSGKSTLAAQLYAELSKRGHLAEYVTEVAKDLVWDQRHNILQYQHLVFGLQHQKLDRLIGKVDFVVTDSPLLLSKYYNEDRGVDYPQEHLDGLVDAMWNRYHNFTIFIRREHGFEQSGRYHEEAQCVQAEWDMTSKFKEHIDLVIGSKNINIKDLVEFILNKQRKLL